MPTITHADRPVDPQSTGKAPKDAHAYQIGWLSRHRGQRVVLRLLDGKQLSGVLQGYDQFALELATDRGALLIYKHAVAYLAPLPVTEGQR